MKSLDELARLHPEFNLCTLAMVLDIEREDNETIDESANKFLQLPIEEQNSRITGVLL